MSDNEGGGSLTALPIIETQEGDVSDYIPTNVISITDGQIYLEKNLFNSGQKPAVNAGISVSRVGGNAQIKAMKSVAGDLRVSLAQYNEVAAFAQFGSDLDAATQEQLANGERLTMILRQGQYQPLSVEEQIVQIYAATPPPGRSSWVREIPAEDVERYGREVCGFLRSQHSAILEEIASSGKIEDDLKTKLNAALDAFAEVFQPSGQSA